MRTNQITAFGKHHSGADIIRSLLKDTAHTAFDPSTQEAEAGGSLWVRGQPGLQSEFQSSQDYTVRLCLKKKNSFPVSISLSSSFVLRKDLEMMQYIS